jgi:hypothetical protein
MTVTCERPRIIEQPKQPEQPMKVGYDFDAHAFKNLYDEHIQWVMDHTSFTEDQKIGLKAVLEADRAQQLKDTDVLLKNELPCLDIEHRAHLKDQLTKAQYAELERVGEWMHECWRPTKPIIEYTSRLPEETIYQVNLLLRKHLIWIDRQAQYTNDQKEVLDYLAKRYHEDFLKEFPLQKNWGGEDYIYAQQCMAEETLTKKQHAIAQSVSEWGPELPWFDCI